MTDAPARLLLDGDALIANWQALDRLSGKAQAGAAVKADAYGLGAIEVVSRLQRAGCRDFFVANWQEAAVLMPLLDNGSQLSVLNGIRPEDMELALKLRAKPVLNTAAQVHLWSATGRRCDVMIDSGMNRLGLASGDPLPDVLNVDIAMSHLASADEDSPQNDEQLRSYCAAVDAISHRRKSLANSAAIMLGADYHFDLTRPGLSLYGGVPRDDLASHIVAVAQPSAVILQVRKVRAGAAVGYNATWRAERDTRVAIVAMGYADGYRRAFSNLGSFSYQGATLPVLGRVSMDLTCVDISAAPHLVEGDWVGCGYDLRSASSQTGISQYELLTGLGGRFDRVWT